MTCISSFLRHYVWAIVLLVSASVPAEEPREQFLQSRRIVLLGDSITAAGDYVVGVEAWLFARGTAPRPEIIDCGLASETVSGLSEAGHADGRFPRPDLADRLPRVLKLTKPDLVFACYGINCGIYEPFDADRFAQYQQGIKQLKSKVEAAGAQLVLITPPFYDDLRAPKSFSYNAVLDQYSDWLLAQRNEGWQVIDLHGPMTREVLKRRQTDPTFTFQPDGVHPNEAGHWFITQQILLWLGDNAAAECATPQEMLKTKGVPELILPLVKSRVTTLRDAYVAAAGHKRPGVAKRLPIAEAELKAKELASQIEAALRKNESHGSPQAQEE